MSRAYRALLISLGGFLFLGGAIALVFSVIMTATARDHVTSFIGGAIAAGIGIVVVQSAYRERVPRWMARLAGIESESQD